MARKVKSCGVDFRNDGIYVTAHALTDHGNVAKEPMVKLPSTATAEELGQVVLSALDSFVEIDGAPPPDHLADFLRFVGAKSWKDFANGTLEVSVTSDDRELTLIPSRADRKGAFLYDNPPTVCGLEAAILGTEILALAEKY